MIDRFGRQIEYARISLTDRCNYRCFYCMPNCGVDKKQHCELLSFEDIFTVILALKELGIRKIRFTGGEPLVRKGVIDLIEQTAKIKDMKVCLTTNGVYLDRYAQRLKLMGIDGVNVSIDTLNDDNYKLITNGGRLSDALNGLNSILAEGITNVKINAVLLKGLNDNEVHDFALFGKRKNVTVRYIELMPFSQGNSFEKYGISANEVIEKYKLQKIDELSFTQNAEYYSFADGTKIGFIRPLSNKFCRYCNRIRLTADGKILPCLHNNTEISIKEIVNDFNLLKETLQDIIYNKPIGHTLDEGVLQCRPMNAIGG